MRVLRLVKRVLGCQHLIVFFPREAGLFQKFWTSSRSFDNSPVFRHIHRIFAFTVFNEAALELAAEIDKRCPDLNNLGLIIDHAALLNFSRLLVFTHAMVQLQDLLSVVLYEGFLEVLRCLNDVHWLFTILRLVSLLFQICKSLQAVHFSHESVVTFFIINWV